MWNIDQEIDVLLLIFLFGYIFYNNTDHLILKNFLYSIVSDYLANLEFEN